MTTRGERGGVGMTTRSFLACAHVDKATAHEWVRGPLTRALPTGPYLPSGEEKAMAGGQGSVLL